MFRRTGITEDRRRVWRLLRLICWSAFVALVLVIGPAQITFAQRSLGLDVSAWQGNISQATWNNIHNIENREFVFIRSSRGGTTGFYNQSDPNNNNGQNTLSQRYDDPYFAQNITRATSAGMFAGAYHFSRPDIIASTPNSGGIANTGTDEANHFLEMAGAWMRPGYLLPVHDFEAGDGVRSDNQMAQFALDFSDRIYEAMGIRPAIYVSGNYANFVLGGASPSLRQQVVAAHPTLWSARWPNQSNPDAIAVQTDHPGTSISWVYGPWDDPPNPTHPWSFWQYASTGRLNSFNSGNSNLDFNVAHGGVEFLKDHLVPALWTTDSDGDWSTLANWNSGQAPIAPVQGPGQVPRVGRLQLPVTRLPAANDTVVLDRPGAEVTVNLTTGDHQIRKLEVREALNITGGSLTLNYVPVAESTPYAARVSAPVSLTGGSLSAHTIDVDAGQAFSLGALLTFDTLHLAPHANSPATLELVGDAQFQPLGNTTATIAVGAGVGSPGFVDLGGNTRIWDVANGPAFVDLAVEVPITNGGLTKTGGGILELSGANTYEGDTSVLAGGLSLAGPVLADSADLYLAAGGSLNLDFAGTDVVDALFIDGVSQATGTWGGTGSGADHVSPLLFGTGLLQVTTFLSPLPGDFNNDGVVNGSDLSQWQGDVGLNADSDADSDGDTDGLDFLTWQRHATLGAAVQAAQAIPEPTTSCLVYASLVLLSARRIRYTKRRTL